MQSNVEPCNRFKFSHISTLLSTIVSHFLHYSVIDQLYAKEVYFCSFVTKSNQTSTKDSPDVFNSFCRTVTHGDSHRIFTNPLKQRFPTFHYRTCSFCCLLTFFHYNPPSPLQMIHKISIGPDKPRTLFFRFKQNSLFGDSPIFSPCWNTPPKVHAVSIDPDFNDFSQP